MISPTLFVLQRGGLAWNFGMPSSARKSTIQPMMNQLPNVKNNADPGDGDHRRHNEGFERKTPGDAENADSAAQIVVSTNSDTERELPASPA